MRIAAFSSHVIQYIAPMWREMSKLPGVELKVHYFSKQGIEAARDHEFGISYKWDVDLLDGYEYEFLPRQWPTTDPCDYSWSGLNAGLREAVERGWDAVWVGGMVHINNWRLMSLCRKLNIPYMMHSDVSILTAFDKPMWKLALKNVGVRYFFSRLDGAFAVGDHAKEYLLHYGARPANTFIVPIPIDVTRFRATAETATPERRAEVAAKFKVPAGKRLIAFTGKFIPRKRPFDFIEAIHRLERDDVVGMMIGDGPLRAEIDRALGSKVFVTGFVNQSELPILLSMASAYVMPSDYDAHPLAVTEALSVGLPVLLSDKCGCYGPTDVLRDGEDGFVYPAGDVDAIVRHLHFLLDNEGERQRMSRRAYELAWTQSAESAAKTFVDATRTILANRGSVPGAREAADRGLG
ncbi:MAG: glycosyltransferase family 4 protein [Phycisphaerales bacterium]|nr:glycosyltransferase family 4 protein [Phycisphaerales bacterium]